MKELSNKLTEIYLEKEMHGYEHVNEAIDNLESGIVVVISSQRVVVYDSLNEAIEKFSYLQDHENLVALKKSGSIDLDDLYIKITN